MEQSEFDAFREQRRLRREHRIEANLAAFDEVDGEFVFRETGEDTSGRPVNFIFREPNRPMVDFYVGTGRWRVVGPRERGDFGKTYSGGGRAFIAWYRKQGRK